MSTSSYFMLEIGVSEKLVGAFGESSVHDAKWIQLKKSKDSLLG